MKKKTTIAVSLALAIAISAVWFVGERPDSEEADTTVADLMEPSLSPVANVSATTPEVERPATPVSAVGDLQSASPKELFGEPNAFDAQFLNARDKSIPLIAATREDVPVTRTRILQANKNAVSGFVATVVRNPSRFDEPVEIEIFPDFVCSLSSAEDVNQTVVPGDLRITTHCDSSPNSYVNIRFNSEMETLTFSINVGNTSYHLAPLGDTGFSLAMEMDFSSLPNRDF